MFVEQDGAPSAPVAVLQPRSEVVNRELLFGDAIVKVRTPKVARRGNYLSPETGEKVPFLQTAQTVSGGLVNFFFHDDIERVEPGELIVAEAQVWKKALSDGREFLYVDYHPVVDGRRPTHRLMVVSTTLVPAVLGDGFTVFKTPTPIFGAIVLMPPDGKLSAVDRELEKLLADGWVEWRERSATFAFLEKTGANGCRMTRAHRLKK